MTVQAYSVSGRLLHVQLWTAGHRALACEPRGTWLPGWRLCPQSCLQLSAADTLREKTTASKVLLLLFFPFSVSQPSGISFSPSASSFLAKTLICFTCSQRCSALCSILSATFPPSDFNPGSFSNWWVTPSPTPNGRICPDLTVKASITTLVFCCEIVLHSKYIHYITLKYYFLKTHTLKSSLQMEISLLPFREPHGDPAEDPAFQLLGSLPCAWGHGWLYDVHRFPGWYAPPFHMSSFCSAAQSCLAGAPHGL